MLRLDSPATKRRAKLSGSRSSTRPGRVKANQFSRHKHRFFYIVGNQQHLLSRLLPKFQQQGLHLVAGEGVQRTKRFVE